MVGEAAFSPAESLNRPESCAAPSHDPGPTRTQQRDADADVSTPSGCEREETLLLLVPVFVFIVGTLEHSITAAGGQYLICPPTAFLGASKQGVQLLQFSGPNPDDLQPRTLCGASLPAVGGGENDLRSGRVTRTKEVVSRTDVTSSVSEDVHRPRCHAE